MKEFILKHQIDRWLNYLIGLLLLFLSLRLLFNPSTIEKFQLLDQRDVMRYALGISEAIASVLFLLNKTRRIGAIGLSLVFVLATYLHLNVGQIPISLAPWTLGILFVVYFDIKRRS